MFFNQAMSVQTDAGAIEDLLIARATLKTVASGCEEFGRDVPDAVLDKITDIEGEIVKRNKADLQRKLKAAKARRAALATESEKRQAADDEITRLEKMLGGK